MAENLSPIKTKLENKRGYQKKFKRSLRRLERRFVDKWRLNRNNFFFEAEPLLELKAYVSSKEPVERALAAKFIGRYKLVLIPELLILRIDEESFVRSLASKSWHALNETKDESMSSTYNSFTEVQKSRFNSLLELAAKTRTAAFMFIGKELFGI